MSLENKFIAFIQTEQLFKPADKLLLAVSGGIDSVVLCDLCKNAGYDFSIAHGNFQLRDEESERDEQFVETLAAKYEVKLYKKKFATIAYANTHKISIQVAARQLRYDWFQEIIRSWDNNSASYILTAHHLDDNIETQLMNFFKGTGIAGLRGILPKSGQIIRPLLFAKKDALKQYAVDHKLKWVEDSSNKSDKYSRNYFRHHIIPLVEHIYPEAMNNLADNIERFRETERVYKSAIDLQIKKLVTEKNNEYHIPVLKLLHTQPLKTIAYELIKTFGFTAKQVDDLVSLLHADSGKYIVSNTHRILRNRAWLIISPLKEENIDNILIEENQSPILFQQKILKIDSLAAKGYQLSPSSDIAGLDASLITFPLLLRKWKKGDYFYPLGMQKKKKLARFFIDQKLSLNEKENTWVVEMNKKIIWVVGKRIDDRFKVNTQTKTVLQLSVQ